MDILSVQRWTCGGNGRVSSALLAEQIGGLVYREVRGVQPSSNPHLSQVQKEGQCTIPYQPGDWLVASQTRKSDSDHGVNEGPCSRSAHTAAMRLAAGGSISTEVEGFRHLEPCVRLARPIAVVSWCGPALLTRAQTDEGETGRRSAIGVVHLVEFAKVSGGASAGVRIRAYVCGGSWGSVYVSLEGRVLLLARVWMVMVSVFFCLFLLFLFFFFWVSFFSCVCSSAPNMESGYSRVPACGSLSVSQMVVVFVVDM